MLAAAAVVAGVMLRSRRQRLFGLPPLAGLAVLERADELGHLPDTVEDVPVPILERLFRFFRFDIFGLFEALGLPVRVVDVVRPRGGFWLNIGGSLFDVFSRRFLVDHRCVSSYAV